MHIHPDTIHPNPCIRDTYTDTHPLTLPLSLPPSCSYPSGYAQLIAEPTQWVVEPMQIDTHNRKYGINEQPGFVPDFIPKLQQDANVTQLVREIGKCDS